MRESLPRVKVQQEVPVTPMNLQTGPANNSPLIVQDPKDQDVLVLANRLDAPRFGCSLWISTNGGRAWLPTASSPSLPRGADTCYGPELAFDRSGTLFYLFVGLKGRGNTPMGAFLTQSRDRGLTFEKPVRVLGPNNFQIRMAVEQNSTPLGRIHLVWLHTASDPSLGGLPPSGNVIQTAFSDDGGRHFSSPLGLSNESQRAVAPALVVTEKAVHVAFYDLNDDQVDYQGLEGPAWEGKWSLIVESSRDGGRHFDKPVLVSNSIAPPGRVMLIFTMAPAAFVSDGNRRLYVAWTDARLGDPDIFFARSADGWTWSEEVRVNDDRRGSGRDQFLPRLSAAPGGRLDMVFYDRRRDGENLRNDVFYTNSVDGGRHFASNLRVTQQPSHSRIGQRYLVPSATGLVEFGSRLGLLSQSDRAVAAWADTRNGRIGSTDQDIFTAEIQLPRTGHRTLPTVRLAFLGGLGVLFLALLARNRVRSRPSLSKGSGAELLGTTGRRGLRRASSRFCLLQITALILAAACGRRVTTNAAGPPIVSVSMREYSFAYPRDIPNGLVQFRVRNAGRLPHRLDLEPIPADFPPIREQLGGSNRRVLAPFAQTATLQPGESGRFAVELLNGQRYALLCLLRGPDGQSHAAKGMNAEFRPVLSRSP